MPGWQGERGSRHERGYGYQWQKIRANVLRRDDHLCQPCYREGTATPATEVDHIIPKSQDGLDDYDNLEAICRSCHADKTNREGLEARGIKPRQRMRFDAKGFPIWE